MTDKTSKTQHVEGWLPSKESKLCRTFLICVSCHDDVSAVTLNNFQINITALRLYLIMSDAKCRRYFWRGDAFPFFSLVSTDDGWRDGENDEFLFMFASCKLCMTNCKIFCKSSQTNKYREAKVYVYLWDESFRSEIEITANMCKVNFKHPRFY